MTAAAMNYFGANTKRQIRVTLHDWDSNVQKVKKDAESPPVEHVVEVEEEEAGSDGVVALSDDAPFSF